MLPKDTHHWGVQRNCIRELFEYSLKRKAEIGAENVYDFSIGNPSIPAPECFEKAITYFYSNNRPKKKGNYWFFLKDKPTLWSDNCDFLINGDILEKYQGKDETIIVPDNVKKIGNRAFYGHELIESVVLPKTVAEIGENAFAYCKNQ